MDEADEACGRWNQLSQQLRAATSTPELTDLLALVGVFVAVGDRLSRASGEGRLTLDLDFDTRRETAVAAHRALSALDDQTSTALEPLHERLVAALASARDVSASVR